MLSDGTRTKVNDDRLFRKNPSWKYVDQFIPDGSMIAGGEIIYRHADGWLWGVKFWDRN